MGAWLAAPALVVAIVGVLMAPAAGGPVWQSADGSLLEASRARISGAQGAGVSVRAAPSLSGEVRVVLGEGVQVRLLGGTIEADDHRWHEVNYDALGISGWVAEQFLVAVPAEGDVFARFAGGWWRRGLGLRVTADGQATASWRVYRWCGPGVAPPCDSMQGNVISDGGRAAIALTRVEADSAYGRVTASTDPTEWPTGADVTLTLQPYGMAELSLQHVSRMLCSSRFLLDAPLAMRAAYPCGV